MFATDSYDCLSQTNAGGTDAWCNESASNCGQCGGFFIYPSKQVGCSAMWVSCEPTSKCCGKAQCLTSAEGWQHCNLPSNLGLSETPVNAVPTKPATAPTTAPVTTLAPQNGPVDKGCCSWDYGNCKLMRHRSPCVCHRFSRLSFPNERRWYRCLVQRVCLELRSVRRVLHLS